MGAAYAGFYAALGCFYPYIVLYYQQLGLNGAEIGILSAIPPLTMAVLAPVWGIVTDRYGVHRLVLRAALLAGAGIVLLLTQVTSFALLLPLTVLLAVCSAPVLPLMDSYGVAISSRHGVSFGRLRLWGSIGFALTTPVIGWLMGGTITSLCLIAYAVMLTLTTGVTLGFPALEVRPQQSVWRGTGNIVRRPAMVILLLTVYLIAAGTMPMFNLFGIYLTQLGGSMGDVGLASAASALSELPVLFFGGWIMKRFGSRSMLIIAMLVFVVRMVAYTLVPAPAWVLPVQLLQGLSYGIYLRAAVTLVQQLVGSELAATAQGLLASSFGFGQITGSLVGGALLDPIGVNGIYRLGAGVMLVALGVYFIGMRRYGAHTQLDQSVPARS